MNCKSEIDLNLAVVTAVWKRPEIFELFAQGIHHLKNHYNFHVIVAGSEGQHSRSMVEKHGFKYVEVKNHPLAHKHNIAVQQARGLKVEYVLFLGSDDILSTECFDIYVEQMKRKVDFVGCTDFYFWDYSTSKASYWGGYIDNRKGHTAGAGRMVSSRLLHRWNWKPFEIKHSHILDNSVQDKLARVKHSSYIFSLKERGVYAVDIKSNVNMTPFELWPNTNYIDSKDLLKNIPCLKDLCTI